MLVVYHCLNNDREKHASALSGADDEVKALLSLSRTHPFALSVNGQAALLVDTRIALSASHLYRYGHVSDAILTGLNCNPSFAQGHPGRLEFEMDAADTLESLLTELPCDGQGTQLSKVLSSITKTDVAVARRLYGAGILLVT